MDRALHAARFVAVSAAIVLLPTALCAVVSRVCLAFAVFDAAVLAIATAYAVYVGVYRYPR